MFRRRAHSANRAPADPLVDDLRQALEPDRVQVERLSRSLYAHDASVFEEGRSGPVCFPLDSEEVQACVRIASRHGRPFVVRGAGTGLAGGAVPLDEPVLIVTTRMNRILSIDAHQRVAWVQPGVVNLDLTRAVAPHGLHFAPDPSSQQSCSIGGNVANNSGGPHCLALGVTSAHVLAIEVVLPDGRITTLGGLDPEPCGYDLRGPSSAARACSGWPRRSRSASRLSRRRCVPCCSTSPRSTTLRQR